MISRARLPFDEIESRKRASRIPLALASIALNSPERDWEAYNLKVYFYFILMIYRIYIPIKDIDIILKIYRFIINEYEKFSSPDYIIMNVISLTRCKKECRNFYIARSLTYIESLSFIIGQNIQVEF